VTPPLRRMAGANLAGALVLLFLSENADAEPATLVCRNREDPGMGATLVLDVEARRLVSASGIGDTILFNLRDVPLRVTAAAVEWEAGYNRYTLNRATLELGVGGQVYLCQRAQRQL
jgi:hypothetical protein